MSSLQRYGPCDPEETRLELYTDIVKIDGRKLHSKAVYNLTLISSFEYSCIVFRADSFKESYETTKIDVNSKKKDKKNEKKFPPLMTNPTIYLRRWCAGPPALCYGFQFLEAHFYVDIYFNHRTKFSVKAYGKIAKIIDPGLVMQFRNKYFGKRPDIPEYDAVLAKLINTKDTREHFWFYNEDYGIQKEQPDPVEEPTTPGSEPYSFDGTPPKDESNPNQGKAAASNKTESTNTTTTTTTKDETGDVPKEENPFKVKNNNWNEGSIPPWDNKMKKPPIIGRRWRYNMNNTIETDEQDDYNYNLF